MRWEKLAGCVGSCTGRCADVSGHSRAEGSAPSFCSGGETKGHLSALNLGDKMLQQGWPEPSVGQLEMWILSPVGFVNGEMETVSGEMAICISGTQHSWEQSPAHCLPWLWSTSGSSNSLSLGAWELLPQPTEGEFQSTRRLQGVLGRSCGAKAASDSVKQAHPRGLGQSLADGMC